MKEEKYKKDLEDIKEIMNRSSRFVSLSGMSGISAGVIALIGAYAAHKMVYSQQLGIKLLEGLVPIRNVESLVLIALATLIAAISAAVFFTVRKTKSQNQKVWDYQTQRLIVNLFIPLLTGGILCLMLLFKGFLALLAPLTLIFYGLALVNASKFTLHEIRSLGLIQIILGLIAINFIGHGLLFWSLGFGLMHILYGIIMQVRYK
ncbi:hypothetical protein HZR84_04745 [Hyphobacterium sp. CCMP332]|nr:hypothetical protein HZR84_04745 [Hyphobacterium sp. CCMP332]